MFAIAYRMVGSVSDAEDLVQEAHLRMQQALAAGTAVDSPKAYLTTVVTRLALDGPCPALGAGDEEPVYPEGEEPFDVWAGVLLELLQRWV